MGDLLRENRAFRGDVAAIVEDLTAEARMIAGADLADHDDPGAIPPDAILAADQVLDDWWP